jgi:hypothetical protein
VPGRCSSITGLNSSVALTAPSSLSGDHVPCAKETPAGTSWWGSARLGTCDRVLAKPHRDLLETALG